MEFLLDSFDPENDNKFARYFEELAKTSPDLLDGRKAGVVPFMAKWDFQADTVDVPFYVTRQTIDETQVKNDIWYVGQIRGGFRVSEYNSGFVNRVIGYLNDQGLTVIDEASKRNITAVEESGDEKTGWREDIVMFQEIKAMFTDGDAVASGSVSFQGIKITFS